MLREVSSCSQPVLFRTTSLLLKRDFFTRCHHKQLYMYMYVQYIYANLSVKPSFALYFLFENCVILKHLSSFPSVKKAMFRWKRNTSKIAVNITFVKLAFPVHVVGLNFLNLVQPGILLTSSGRMTCKHANYFRGTDRRASIHAFRFLCVFAGRLVNTPRVACHHGGWRVYTPSLLGVPEIPGKFI